MPFESWNFKLMTSLQRRFTLGLFAVLTPLVAVAGAGYFYLLPALIHPLDGIVREFTDELEPAVHIQMALLQVAMPVNDYLIHGSPGERQEFVRLRTKVDQAFEDAGLPMQSSLGEERALIIFAHREWVVAKHMGEQLLLVPDPIGNTVAAQEMERFDAHIDRAVASLDEVHQYFRGVIDSNRAQAMTTRARILWASIAAFLVAFAASAFAGVALARSVTGSVATLRRGVARLSVGELSHRVAVRHDDELGELAIAFNTMADALETSRMELTELANHDGLTGLYNHQRFYTLLNEELARGKRFDRPVSLLLLDIDHFKRVNDAHGHQAGDTVLKGLSRLLVHQARTIDRVCRYGGEEICVILPETALDVAASMAERLRLAVEAYSFAIHAGAPLRITVSIGVASWPVHANDAHALVAATDTALYAAKRGGRNRVVCYEPSLVKA
jgi:two-component system cell cycle response regulator